MFESGTIFTVLSLALSLAASILAAILKRRARRQEKTDATQVSREQRILWVRARMAQALRQGQPDIYAALHTELLDLLTGNSDN